MQPQPLNSPQISAPPTPGVFQFLQHQHRRSFADHESVALAIERPGGARPDRSLRVLSVDRRWNPVMPNG